MDMAENEEKNDTQSPLSEKYQEHLIKSRKIFITGEINQKMAELKVLQLHALAHISDDPIYVFISSPGGHVESGDMIYDAIRFIKPKVYVIGSGWVASAGALIFVAADKENRYTLPNTRFLLHQPSGGYQGPATNVKIYMEEILTMRERLNKIFANATGQTIEKIRQDTERDFWLSSQQAVEYGLVSKVIVTEDELPRK
ncbi:ATP-dependent Clp protease proteolytic subunit [Erwinia endophytica]|uniref:ATP-dependent Clp protease proteolytic subunit n=1 Tax=Erwinia endophytica TaxID=1563158 RepID=UPI001F044CFA|nr:ATP-dependent Clp protease proteolytic subunit [Erwinia endophytica]